MLAAEEHLGGWAARNSSFGPAIGEACDLALMMHDLGASAQIAAWAYEQAAALRGCCGGGRVRWFRLQTSGG
jgi:hypothetical protein